MSSRKLDPQFMVNLYHWQIDQWLEDTPLTKHQEMFIKCSGESLETMLRVDLERLEHWKNELAK